VKSLIPGSMTCLVEFICFPSFMSAMHDHAHSVDGDIEREHELDLVYFLIRGFKIGRHRLSSAEELWVTPQSYQTLATLALAPRGGPARYSRSGRLTEVRLSPVGLTTPKINSLGGGVAEVEILIGGYYPAWPTNTGAPLQGARCGPGERRLQQALPCTKASGSTGGAGGPLGRLGGEGNKSLPHSANHPEGN